MQRLGACLVWVGLLALPACSGTHERAHEPAAVAPLRPAPALNLPALMGLSIDAVDRRLGARQPVPAGFFDPANAPLLARGDALDSLACFRYHGLTLVAAYDHQTRQVTDFLLLGTDEDDLMQRAQLQPTAARYLVLPVFQQQHPTELLGLRVLATGTASREK